MAIYPIILSGGSGSRLWPLSRQEFPKQFLNLNDERTLLQRTAMRLKGLEDVENPIVITSEEQRFLIAEQLNAIGVSPLGIALEPEPRNTAPAIAIGARLAQRHGGDSAVILVLPADHTIENKEEFSAIVSEAASVADAGRLVTFGILPNAPHTGYGYIRRGAPVLPYETCYSVDKFIEKPTLDRAEALLLDGQCYWNSGMFMFRADILLAELGRLRPDILLAADAALAGASADLNFLHLDPVTFAACPSEAIDYCVMEKTELAAVIVATALGWNDIGSWAALAETSGKDNSGNSTFGDVLAIDSRDCYVYSERRLVAVLGVENLVVVETPDAILVTKKDRAQDVKSIVEKLNFDGRSETKVHRKVVRPWGSYECLDTSDRFQVKRIIVNPGASLSLQMHFHRAEHWIVVKGTAKVVRGEDVMLLSENQSTYIPLGVAHRLENPGKVLLELIEVQSGSYLGEDDIVRLEDHYGRK